MKPMKEVVISHVCDGKVIGTSVQMMPDMDAPDIDDGALTVEQLITSLTALPNKHKKVYVDTEHDCECLIGLRERDEHFVVETKPSGT